jgi:hypothetical protein
VRQRVWEHSPYRLVEQRAWQRMLLLCHFLFYYLAGWRWRPAAQ